MNAINIGLRMTTLLAAFFLLGSCSSLMESIIGGMDTEGEEKSSEKTSEAEVKKPVSVSGDASDQKIVGTWVNPEYGGKGRSAKLEYTLNSDGTLLYVAYDNEDGSGNKYEGTIRYIEQWIDAQGRLNGKSKVTLSEGMSWETLDRISTDGSTLEVQPGIAKIDPKGPQYSIYYRQ